MSQALRSTACWTASFCAKKALLDTLRKTAPWPKTYIQETSEVEYWARTLTRIIISWADLTLPPS